MRIADTLLRRGHLSEDALADAWYAGTHPAHLDTCDVCAERALEMSRWLEHTRDLGIAGADAAFPAERLAVQQAQIMRKLEQMDRPSKLLSFPRAAADAQEATGFLSAMMPAEFAGQSHRVSSRWIAAAAAAGLILGVVGGRLSMWQPQAPAAPVAASASAKAPEVARADDSADLLDSEISQPQIHSLSALDALTPQVKVTRASNRRR